MDCEAWNSESRGCSVVSLKKPSRERHHARLDALIEDFLDHLSREHLDGFDLGAIAVSVEVLTEAPMSDYLKRSDAGYTPGDDVNSYFTYWCSDHRPHVQAAMFRDVYYYTQDLADRRALADEDDDGDEPGTAEPRP
jgi:hypothetical protein